MQQDVSLYPKTQSRATAIECVFLPPTDVARFNINSDNLRSVRRCTAGCRKCDAPVVHQDTTSDGPGRHELVHHIDESSRGGQFQLAKRLAVCAIETIQESVA